MKKLVSIKGVIDNIRQSVNTPSPPGMGGPSGPVRLEQDVLETVAPDQLTLENTVWQRASRRSTDIPLVWLDRPCPHL